MERKDISNYTFIGEEPRGYNKKYWVNQNGNKIIKYNNKTVPDGDVMEYLSYLILKKLNISAVKVELGYNSSEDQLQQLGVDNPNCCIIDSFLTEQGDVTIQLRNKKWVKSISNNEDKNIRNCFHKVFNIFSSLDDVDDEQLEIMKKSYIRMILGDCILDNEDRPLKNIEAIYNEKNRYYRLAPSFDNGLAFNAYEIGSDEQYCYIGQQPFKVSSILEYIKKYFGSYVEDIIINLEKLLSGEIDIILRTVNDDLSEEKQEYIVNHLQNIYSRLTETKINNKKI